MTEREVVDRLVEGGLGGEVGERRGDDLQDG